MVGCCFWPRRCAVQGTLLVDGRRRCSKLRRAGGTLTVDVRAPRSSIKIVQPGRSEKGTDLESGSMGGLGLPGGKGLRGVVVGC